MASPSDIARAGGGSEGAGTEEADASRVVGATFWANAREALVAATRSVKSVGIDRGIVAGP